MNVRMPRVAIIGGSLAGLTAALALQEIGCDVNIYERARARLSGMGAGIVLNPVTVAYLHGQPNFDLDSASITTQHVHYLSANDEIVHDQVSPHRLGSYNTLYRELIGRFDAARYHLSATLRAISQKDDIVSAQLLNGKVIACDLLVCADGIRSAGRHLLFPEIDATYAGYVAFRGTVKQSQMETKRYDRFADAITYHLLPSSHLLVYPIPHDGANEPSGRSELNWLWYRNVTSGQALSDLLMDRDGVTRDLSVPLGMMSDNARHQLHEDAAVLPASLRDIVRATERPFVQVIVDLEMKRMVSGRACLIGDAAFVARPHAAAGTAKAAADALSLARALSEANGDVPTALARWEPAQLALGMSVVARTRLAGRRAQVTNEWQVGEALPFGLYQSGDSIMA